MSAGWLLARGAGLSAYVLLSAAVALGLALPLRIASPSWPRLLTRGLHEWLTGLALAMVGVHLTLLLADSQAGVGPLAILVPFSASYRPLATGLGAIALEVLVVTWVSSRLRGRIGQARWRAMHRVAIAAWAAALLHGLLAGSDRGAPWAVFGYALTGVAVGGLFLLRVTGSGQSGASSSSDASRRAATQAGSKAAPASFQRMPSATSRSSGLR